MIIINLEHDEDYLVEKLYKDKLQELKDEITTIELTEKKEKIIYIIKNIIAIAGIISSLTVLINVYDSQNINGLHGFIIGVAIPAIIFFASRLIENLATDREILESNKRTKTLYTELKNTSPAKFKELIEKNEEYIYGEERCELITYKEIEKLQQCDVLDIKENQHTILIIYAEPNGDVKNMEFPKFMIDFVQNTNIPYTEISYDYENTQIVIRQKYIRKQ